MKRMINKGAWMMLLLLLAAVSTLSAQELKKYDAIHFGIKADGITNNTASIQRAIDIIHERGGGRLWFSVGRYITGSIELKSNVTIHMDGGSVLVLSPSIYEYKGIGDQKALIYADGQENIAIDGEGVLEGSGSQALAGISDQLAKGHITDGDSYVPALVLFNNCKNVMVQRATLQNFATTAMQMIDCQNVKINQTYLFANGQKAAALKLAGCQTVNCTDSFWNTDLEPVVSAGTSTGLSFNGVVRASGKVVKVSK